MGSGEGASLRFYESERASQREYGNNKMGRSAIWKEFLFCIYGDSSISLDPLNYNLLQAINSDIEFYDAYRVFNTIIL